MMRMRYTTIHAAAAVAIAALSALTGTAQADIEPVTIDVGTFMNTSTGVNYNGTYGDFFSSTVVSGQVDHIVLNVDVAGILTAAGMNRLISITATDTGENSYGTLSPGADVDLMTFNGLPGDAIVEYLYEGPNNTHTDESPNVWAQRVTELDTFSGAQDKYHFTHVSLGNEGRLTATFSSPGDPGDPGGQDGIDIFEPIASGFSMNFSQAGSPESFSLSITAVPGPGPLALLMAGGLIAGGRQRRG